MMIVALALLGALCLAPAAAEAVVITTPLESGELTVGLQPRSTILYAGAAAEPGAFDNESGAPVLASSKVYAIYWDPAAYYHGDWQHLIDGFLHNMGSSSGSLGTVFSVDAQYTDAAGAHASYSASFKGAYTDTHPYPTERNCTDPAPLLPGDAITCLTDAQLRQELQRFIGEHHELPTGMGTVYYLLTPPGVTACLGEGGIAGRCSDYEGEPLPGNPSYTSSFCSYHSAMEPTLPDGGPGTILYAVIPWSAGGLGDYHLAEADETPAYRCQDGGLDPSGKVPEEPEAQAHQQEPNQQAGRGPDGSFDTGLADLIINQIAVEQQNIVTDPLLNGWQDPQGNEAVDECRNFFAPTSGGTVNAAPETGAGTLYNQSLSSGHYYLNDVFNLAALKQGYPGIPCIPGVVVEPQFTAPNTVNSGEVVGFDGSESDVTLDAGQGYTAEGNPFPTYTTYHWSFGDGSEASSATPGQPSTVDEPAAFHSYAYGGVYDVTLTVTDTAGNTASVTQQVTVDGPPPPPPPSAPSTTSASAKASITGASGQQGAQKPLSRPVATAIVTTHSLTEAVKKGLPVRYSVNEQVAGRVEVLLSAKLARRLKIRARSATGLAKGTPPQRVIAQVLLDTMRSAHGTLKILIPGEVGRRLLRLQTARLMVRMVVRNASHSAPKSTVLVLVAKLHR